MFDLFYSFDLGLLHFFNGHQSEALTAFMRFVTGRTTWIPLYFLFAALIVWRCGWKKGLLMVAICGAAVGLTDWFCASVIRPEVARLRPVDPANPIRSLLQPINNYCPRSFSFPSCHAANNFALVSFVILVVRRWWFSLSALLWALLICISRLYFAVHFPTDIIAGAIIGSAIGVLAWWGGNKIRFSKNIAAFLLFLPLFQPLSAEKLKFEWGGDFNVIFDNREGGGEHTPAETYFLTRLAPEVGLSFHKGEHRIMGGAVWVQPIGCEWKDYRLSPTLYYRYQGKHISGSLGMFPRRQLIRELPDYLMSDSLDYFQNNLRGALLQVHTRRGFFEAMVDWRGMQSATQREAFAIIAQGEYQRKLWGFGGVAMLNHLALTKPKLPGQHVVDNMVANPFVYTDLASPAGRRWKEISLSAGPIASLTRDRGDNRWRSSVGVRAELALEWWRLRLHEAVSYTNRPLFPLYERYGAVLSGGEPYFAARCYSRTELSGLLVSYRDMVSLRAELDFHVTPHDFMFYQRLILKVTI